MTEYIGKVLEVFIPTEKAVDIMESKKVGFKIELEDGNIIEVEQEQDELNSRIMKNNTIRVLKRIISDKEFIDIEKLDGDEYE